MRDPKRIDEILAALREAWLKAPDERLGQFLDNCCWGEFKFGEETQISSYRTQFRFLEDDRWLDLIKSRFANR